MDTALHQYLRAALSDRLFYLLEDIVPAEHIGFRAVLGAVERAELAFIHADIGVVDIPINNECHDAF
jgi:hypothetical protein